MSRSAIKSSSPARHFSLVITIATATCLVLGCGEVVTFEKSVNVAELAKTWPAYRTPSRIDPASPIGQMANRMDAKSGGLGHPLLAPQNVAARRNAFPPVTPKDEWGVEQVVVDALGRIGESAVPQVMAQLQNTDPQKRIQAAKILARIGPDANAAVADLTALLNDSNAEVQKEAARALGQIGPAAENSVEALLDILAN